MMKPLSLLIVFFAVALSASSFAMVKKSRHTNLFVASAENPAEAPIPTDQTPQNYPQTVDHFSRNSAKFTQRYYISETFSDKKDDPVFYSICGEYTCDGSVDYIVSKFAKLKHAKIVTLEHRYYGYSQPFKNKKLTAENLKYLTIDQALEDLAEVQTFLQKTKGYSGKWISVGGSYAGLLSAFYRVKHPELVVGALASSAPVFAKEDFFEYDRHVAEDASPNCLKLIRDVVSETENDLNDAKKSITVKNLFRSAEIRNPVDFLYVIADTAAIAFQYGKQKEFCGALSEGAKAGNTLKAYAKYAVAAFKADGMTPVQDSFQGYESTDWKDYLASGLRPWMYHSCTELGFFQIANPNRDQSARSAQITLDYHHDVCKRLFGITNPVNTDRTNRTYYEKLMNHSTTNIFFTNGSVDPWSNLSMTEKNPDASSNSNLNLMTLLGGSHCSDLGEGKTKAILAARDKFQELATRWLKEN